jgi:peptidyl-prolyl cis-trans isomerase C
MSMKKVFCKKWVAGLGCVLLAMFCQGLWAAEKENPSKAPDDPVLIKNEWTEVRKSDYETALLRLPEDTRGGFSNQQKRIIQLLSRLLRDKTLAAMARAEKLDQDPEVKAQLAAEIDRFHTLLYMAKIDRDAAEAFAKKEADYAARAQEIYLTNRKNFELPERVEAAHILFDLKQHSKEEGLKLAQDLRAKIVAGEDFGKAAERFSEDKGSASRMGELGWFSRGEVVPEFSEAAFALKKVGDVSEPVLTDFGWHLILLKGKKDAGLMPFDEAKPNIINEQRQKFIEEYRNKELAKINDDPKAVLNEAAIDALYFAPPSPEKMRELLLEAQKSSEKKNSEGKNSEGKEKRAVRPRGK